MRHCSYLLGWRWAWKDRSGPLNPLQCTNGSHLLLYSTAWQSLSRNRGNIFQVNAFICAFIQRPHLALCPSLHLKGWYRDERLCKGWKGKDGEGEKELRRGQGRSSYVRVSKGRGKTRALHLVTNVKLDGITGLTVWHRSPHGQGICPVPSPCILTSVTGLEKLEGNLSGHWDALFKSSLLG